jgi:hypothetical protein
VLAFLAAAAACVRSPTPPRPAAAPSPRWCDLLPRRAGSVTGTDEPDNRVVFGFDGFSILTSRPLLQGRRGDPSRGGSGLTTWR